VCVCVTRSSTGAGFSLSVSVETHLFSFYEGAILNQFGAEALNSLRYHSRSPQLWIHLWLIFVAGVYGQRVWNVLTMIRTASFKEPPSTAEFVRRLSLVIMGWGKTKETLGGKTRQ